MFPRQCINPQRKLARKLYVVFLTEYILDAIFKSINNRIQFIVYKQQKLRDTDNSGRKTQNKDLV